MEGLLVACSLHVWSQSMCYHPMKETMSQKVMHTAPGHRAGEELQVWLQSLRSQLLLVFVNILLGGICCA